MSLSLAGKNDKLVSWLVEQCANKLREPLKSARAYGAIWKLSARARCQAAL